MSTATRSIAVEHFLHGGPPLAGLAGFERFLTGDAMRPPFLRARIGRHQSHVGIVVLADILEVGKQEAVLVVDRVVANPALGDFCQNLGPSGSVEFFVFLVFLSKSITSCLDKTVGKN